MRKGLQRSLTCLNKISDAFSSDYLTALAPTLLWNSALNIKIFEVGLDPDTDLFSGDIPRAVTAYLVAYTGTKKFRASVYEFDSSIDDTSISLGGYAPIVTTEMTPAELGLTLDATTSKFVEIPIDSFVAVAGKQYRIVIECFEALRVHKAFGLGYTNVTDSRQRRRGWYSTNGTITIAIDAGFQSSVGAEVAFSEIMDASTEGRIKKASASVAGMVVSLLSAYDHNGSKQFAHGSQTLTAAAALNVRYDVIYFDADAGTFGVQSGIERTTDPSEFIPALTLANRIALFNCRVTDTAVTTTSVWGVFNTENRVLSESLERERRRSRMCLPKTLAKVSRGNALHIVSMGDSILALQSATPSTDTPNGSVRDKEFYLEQMGSDVKSALTKYTAIQLGRPDDGAGAIYIAISFVWQLARALQATGQSVLYDNFAIGGTNTSNAVDAGLAPTAWLTNVIALAPDLVILNFGSNERGDAATERRMVAVINHLKAAGIEVIVNGCARPVITTAGALTQWEYTNRVLERAAKFANVAFMPMFSLYNERFLGAIGCDVIDVSSANRINHPGILEHSRIGRDYIKLIMGSA
jgi:hypothetical protein